MVVEKTPAPHNTGVGRWFAPSIDEPKRWRRLRAVSELQCCLSHPTGTVHSSCSASLASALQRKRSTWRGGLLASLLTSVADDGGDGRVSTEACSTRVSLGTAYVSSWCQMHEDGVISVRAVKAGRNSGRLTLLLAPALCTAAVTAITRRVTTHF